CHPPALPSFTTRRSSDLSVMPSVALEGFGLPTIESLAAGTPVIVTPVGGLPETILELDPALVTANCGASAIADSLIYALRHLERSEEHTSELQSLTHLLC